MRIWRHDRAKKRVWRKARGEGRAREVVTGDERDDV